MKIYALRHGKTRMNALGIINGLIDEPLIDEGIEQAKIAAKNIPTTIKVIISSPLMRAKHTAELVAQDDIDVTTDQRLREVSMGSLAGKTWPEMPDGHTLMVKHRNIEYDYTPWAGEDVEQVKERVINFITELAETYKDEEVLIVTHGGIVRMFMLLESGELAGDRLPNAKILSFDTDKMLS